MSVADLARYELAVPRALPEACQLLAARVASGEPTLLCAGGTDLLVELGMAPPLGAGARPPLCVDLSRLPELGGVERVDRDGPRIRIGAGVSYLALGRHALVEGALPLLARMSHDIGGPTIQARGTLGGNLATGSPAADGVAALAAHDATVVLTSVRGERRVPFAGFQTGYKRSVRQADEIITAFELEPLAPGSPWCWRKVGARQAQAISKVAFAAVAELEGGRARRFGAAMASMAPVTATLPATRALVLGTPLAGLDGEALDRAVAADTSPIDDIRSTRAYRAHAARALARGFLRELGAAV
ncbi:MAG: FAD binding domain-containing protein [Polyangiaceae bacterium]|nr:FAD binding domain-containing protein [Polyangiaceae bacterium]